MAAPPPTAMTEKKRMKKKSLRGDTARENKWTSTLFKKAKELSVLTDAKVAIVLHTSTGKLKEFVSPNHSMKDILEQSLRDLGENAKKNLGGKRHLLESNGCDGNGIMLPTEDSDMPLLEYHTPESNLDDMTHENLQHPTLSKSDMHMILESSTNEEMEHFELQLKQAMIRLLKGKASMVEKEEQVKGQKVLSGAGDWEEIQLEVGSTSRTKEVELSSEGRNSDEIQFEFGSTSRNMEGASSSSARDKETIWFDVVEMASSSSGPQESVEFQENMELDLELSLGPSRWR